MEYKIRHCYSGIDTYVLDFVGGTNSDSRVCYSCEQLVGLIAWADSEGHKRANDWLDAMKDCPSAYRYIVEKIVEANKVNTDVLVDRIPVDYYEYSGYGDEHDHVAVKGINYDWHTGKTTVSLYVLDYDSENDWHATDKVRIVSLDYFKKAFKYAGACYLY